MPHPQATTHRMKTDASVLVVIVNYRTAALVVDCLRSLQDQVLAHGNTRVTVVDNVSGDGSADVIDAAIHDSGWAPWATLVRAPLNGGFAYGNNVAVRPALNSAQAPDFFWLLNPDTVVQPGALQGLVGFAREHPEAGICGSGIDDPDGTPWPFAFRFPSAIGNLESGLRLGVVTRLLKRWAVVQRMNDQPARVDWVSGCSMLVRREVFETVGLMDEGFFLYFEETDFCLAAQRAGWQCWFTPAGRVTHISGQSTGVTGSQAAVKRLPAYWHESRRRYWIKNHGRARAALADSLWLAGFVLWRMRRVIQRKADPDPPHLLRDFVRHSALLRGDLPVNRAVFADASTAATPTSPR